MVTQACSEQDISGMPPDVFALRALTEIFHERSFSVENRQLSKVYHRLLAQKRMPTSYLLQ